MKVIAIICLIASLSLFSCKFMGATAAVESNLQEIGNWVKGLFTSNENCHEFIKHEIEIWGLLQKPGERDDPNKVKIKFADIQSSIDSPHMHVDKIVNCANTNTYLLKAIINGKSSFFRDYNSWDSAKKRKFAESTKTAVCYSSFLTIMTQWIESDFPRSAKFFKQLDAFIAKFSKIDIKGVRWYNYTDSFGNIKINTVFLMMGGMLEDIVNRKVIEEDKKGCGVRMNRISVNIAEAMFFDARAGMVDNAKTGSALVVTPAHDRVDPNLETELPKFSSKGIYQVFQPFPDLWADLYQVWNLAFTAQEYADFPMFWAKLLNPEVGCYRGLKGSYLFQRAINLAMHIVHQLIEKNERQNQDPGYDVRPMSFVASFGTTNKASADEYINKVQNSDRDVESKTRRARKLDETNRIVLSLTRGTLESLKALYSAIKTECSKKEISNEEEEGFFSSLWRKITGGL